MLTVEERQYFTKITNYLGSIAESLNSISKSLETLVEINNHSIR